jgi:four helix bundle protein
MKDFRQLSVWSKAHDLTLLVYKSTASFPKDEMFGLTSQTRRAAASIPANIAEGCGHNGDAELARFMRIALGSASELEYHLLLASELSYLNPAQYEEVSILTVEVKRMLGGFISKLSSPTEASRRAIAES